MKIIFGAAEGPIARLRAFFTICISGWGGVLDSAPTLSENVKKRLPETSWNLVFNIKIVEPNII